MELRAGVAAKAQFLPAKRKSCGTSKNPEKYIFNLDAVRDPNVKYPKQRKKRQAEVQSPSEEPNGCLAFSEGNLGRKSEFEGANAAPGVISRRRRRADNPGVQQSGRCGFRPLRRVWFSP